MIESTNLGRFNGTEAKANLKKAHALDAAHITGVRAKVRDARTKLAAAPRKRQAGPAARSPTLTRSSWPPIPASAARLSYETYRLSLVDFQADLLAKTKAVGAFRTGGVGFAKSGDADAHGQGAAQLGSAERYLAGLRQFRVAAGSVTRRSYSPSTIRKDRTTMDPPSRDAGQVIPAGKAVGFDVGGERQGFAIGGAGGGDGHAGALDHDVELGGGFEHACQLLGPDGRPSPLVTL